MRNKKTYYIVLTNWTFLVQFISSKRTELIHNILQKRTNTVYVML